MKYKLGIKAISVISSFLLFSFQGSSQTLEQQVVTKIGILNSLIAAAENEGIDAYKEKMTVRTAEIFLKYADWDENNVIENTTYFELVPIYRDSAEQMATMLPDFERRECIIMLDEAIDYLSRLKAGEVFRVTIPQIDWAAVSHQNDQLTFNNRPVFLGDYTWKPDIPNLTEYHGNQDGFYISPVHVIDSNGIIKSSIINDLSNQASGTAGFIFLNNKNIPEWAKTYYGDSFFIREDTFTAYDIDHPGAKEMMGYLLDGTVPLMADKKYTELGYMLCNEPHFFTKADAWATGPVSDYTIEKFKLWLAVKHASIANLNAVWKTNYNSFSDVTMSIPMNGNLQGTPIWYDWMSFNMFRVTNWYEFLKSRILESDPDAKIHLKIMPRLWVDNWKDHGIDLEALTRMSEIIGNDAGAWNNHMWGPTEWWESDYAFDWREMSMGYDFMKSVSPDKIAFNSEAHYLSKNKSRNLYEDPTYARATYWLAHTLGENATQSWFWARREDGSVRLNAGKGYAGSNNHQPRIVNEVASTFMDLNSHSEAITTMQRQLKPIRIFYSKTSAINKTEHMDDVFDVYKALFFEGVPLGFATKDIINLHDHSEWEVILIHQTEYVTREELAALQGYLDEGGTILMDHSSLKMDEYGYDIPALDASNGTLTTINSIPAMRAAVFELLDHANLIPDVSVSETNSGSTKGVTWKCIKNHDNSNILSIVNLGNTDATIQLELQNAVFGTKVKNLLNGLYIPSVQVLRPNGVLFVEVTDGSSTVGIGELKKIKRAKIFPNPSLGSFQIDFFKFQKKIELLVFNTEGKIVLKKKYKGVLQIKEDISNQVSGKYLIQVRNDGEIQNLVFIKQ